jgi:hypothetical protein
MLLKPTDKLRKTELLLNKNPNQPPKRNLLQSQEFTSSRRHSVYGQEYDQLTARVISKEMKSLPKYKTAVKGEHTDRKTQERHR